MSSGRVDRRAVWAMADLARWQERVEPDRRGPDYLLREIMAAGLDRVVWSVRQSDDTGELEAAAAFARRRRMTLHARIPVRIGVDRTAVPSAWRYVDRRGEADPLRSSLFVESARQNRIAAALDAVRQGAEGVVLDFCEFPPHAGYHPDLIHEYVVTGGPDPRTLALTDDGFRDWCLFRAHYVTEFLYGLRKSLALLERDSGRRLSLTVRLPEDGLELNLAAGMDVQGWLRHRLADPICVSPLRWLSPGSAESAGPYVAAASETGVGVLGEIGLAPPPKVRANPVVALQRTRELYACGARGLMLEGVECAVLDGELRWILSSLSEPKHVNRLLSDQDRVRQYPVSEANRGYGVSAESAQPGSAREPFPATEL